MKFHPKNCHIPLRVRFWTRVNKDGPIHPVHGQCWMWDGHTLPNGYGEISVNGDECYVHRVSYRMKYGPFNTKLHVCHKCDNKLCVNPKHLFLGTCRDNRLDSVSKDRHARGERQAWSKLTDAMVMKIRNLYKPKCRKYGATAFSRRFGISPQSAWEAAVGKTWKHLTPRKAIYLLTKEMNQ